MIIIKLKVQNEIRRLGTAPKDLSEVKKKAKNYFKIENPCFWYIDQDKDKVTFDSQDEYEEILRFGINPLTFNVEDSDLLSLVRSTSISGIIPIEPRPPLSLSKTESLSLQNSLCLIDKSHMKIKKRKKERKNDETQTSDVQFFEKDTQFKTDVGLDLVLETVKKEALNKREENKRIYMKAKCSFCTEEIFNCVFKCSQCEGFFNCKKCALENEHQHILIKSNFIITSHVTKGGWNQSCIEPRNLMNANPNYKSAIGLTNTKH
jgi:hypothetical protein